MLGLNPGHVTDGMLYFLGRKVWKSGPLQSANPADVAQGNRCAIPHQSVITDVELSAREAARETKTWPSSFIVLILEEGSLQIPPTSVPPLHSTTPQPPSSHSLPREVSFIWCFQISITVQPQSSSEGTVGRIPRWPLSPELLAGPIRGPCSWNVT